ncbi:hypothetical protein Tsubulata_021891, partial [Turnera subulata]
KLYLHRRKNLPPSPLALPIIGHLHLLKDSLHKSLQSLSSKYGPILYLKFGTRPTLVVSSPSAIEECFTKNDNIFANRPPFLAGEFYAYNYKSYVFAGYGNYWRTLRRLTVEEIFSAKGIRKFSPVFQEEVHSMLRRTLKLTSEGTMQKVDLNFLFSLLATDITMRIAAGRRCLEEEEIKTKGEKQSFKEFNEMIFTDLTMSILDFFPFLRMIGYGGVEKNMKKLQARKDEYLQNIVNDSRSKRTHAPVSETENIDAGGLTSAVEILLTKQESEPDFYTDDVIKAMIIMMMMAGTDTVRVTLEWAMALLLTNPKALQKLKLEIDTQVGTERLLDESDIPSLPYLKCVINETLRIYPAGAITLPHFSSEACTVGGYNVPSGTTLLPNVWALHRDPEVWPDPDEFKPERFEEAAATGRGSEGVKFAPFGVGRRKCPAANLAVHFLCLAVGAVVQCFEWNTMGLQVDMDHCFDLVLLKKKPLEAMCTPRPNMTKFLSQATPSSIPIIGHLHLMKVPVHRTLQNLSNQYGPIMLLSFGTRKVLVISSPNLVEECFNKNDIVFANRPQILVSKHLNYNSTTIGASNYGHHWRNLRRLAALEIFSTNRLNMFLSIRQEEVRHLLKNLYEISHKDFSKVEMKSRISELSFNIIMRMTAGKRYFGAGVDDLDEAKRFCDTVREVFEASGASEPSDFVPYLRWIDFKGREKRMIALHKRSDELWQGLIDEHRKSRTDSRTQQGRTKTMIDTALSLQEAEPHTYTDEIIKGLIMTMITGGTDTSAVTIEWALSLLLNHPRVLEKARAELDNQVGQDRLVDEHDFSKLPYLQSIINETMRLYPAAPLLVPHQSSDSCTIGGYYVPRDTMLLVNAWAMHRDPAIWDDANTFRPERFLGQDINDAYKFVPFGVGRRSCPGSGLANRVVGLALASLIQCFEWERVCAEEIDMTEGTGLTMPKAKPFEAMCKARESMVNVLSTL